MENYSFSYEMDTNSYEMETKKADPEILKDQFHCVEFPVNGHKYNYRCRLRRNRFESIFVLVKENSAILNGLTVGNILKMKYYRTEAGGPPESFDTEIKYITKNDSGRFKGHYLMGLDILYDRNQTKDG
jgi:hypothetical protein